MVVECAFASNSDYIVTSNIKDFWNAELKGFGFNEGAIASTVAHDSHNLLVAGVTEADMAFYMGIAYATHNP